MMTKIPVVILLELKTAQMYKRKKKVPHQFHLPLSYHILPIKGLATCFELLQILYQTTAHLS